MTSPIQKRRAESELNVFRQFRMSETRDIFFVTERAVQECAKTVAFATVYKGNEEYWVDSSGKADPTPDLFSKEYETMVEIMRVDDHAFETEDGKIINHSLAADSKRFNELVKSGILDQYPDAQIMVTSNTGLPTLEDHNYLRYKANFKRVVSDHISKIPTYRKNHPECRYLTFLIFDESSGYFEFSEPPKELKRGVVYRGRPHLWFIDEDFIDVFRGSDIDCVIWYAPYKYAESRFLPEGLPSVSVYFKNETIPDIRKYDENRVLPAEE